MRNSLLTGPSAGGKRPSAPSVATPLARTQATKRRSSMVIVTFLAFLLLQMSLVAFLIDQTAIAWNVADTALVLLLLLGNGLLFTAIVSPTADMAAICVYYFVIVSYGITGLYQELADRFPWPVVHAPEQSAFATFVVGAFLVAFAIGQRAKVNPKPDTVLGTGGWTSVVVDLLMVLSVGCFFLAGPTNVLMPRAEAGDADLDMQTILLGKSLLLPAFLYLLYTFRLTPRSQFLLQIPRLIFASILALIWFNPISAARFHFIGFLLASAAVLFSWWRPNTAVKGGIVSLLLIVNYVLLGPLKSLASARLDGSFFSDLARNIQDYAFRVDFDSYQVGANAVVHMDRFGPNYGTSILGALFFYVPRALWASKPVGTSLVVHDDLGYVYTNLSFPLPFEFYSAGGLAVVIVVAYLIGKWLKSVSQQAAASDSEGVIGVSAILFALVIGYAPILLRGSLNAVVPHFGFSFLAVGLMYLAGKRKPFRRAVRA